jgi:ParB/RepB/Spo0J family partition protein
MITTNQKTKAGPQANEHGVYVKNVKEIKVPFPKAAGKTKVTINLVQDLHDEMWRSSYSVTAGSGGTSSLPSALSTPHRSREGAIVAAAEKAREFLLSEVERGNLSEASKQQVRAALPALDKWIIANTDSPFCEKCGCVPVACRCSKDDEDEENGFHPGFPPNFDPERAEKGLAQEDGPADPEAERLHKEAIAMWRDRKSPSDDGNGYHPQMLRMIPINNIEPSPTNPRKHFDPAKLQELADSISEHGLVEPILVRPIRQSYLLEDCFQLVAGERRWRAAKLAGLTQIEAKVRDLDDKAVLEIQFIENLQRADLSPIEEAEGYKRLLDEHGYTADSLAGKLAKSKSYVYGRLKLCNLPEAALDALAKGLLPATIGELIGRLPSMEMRQKFWDDNYWDIGKDWFEMPSFRDVKMEIERGYMRELKSAPWNKKDANLVSDAVACINCPKMTGNNRAEYPDARADMCTDTGCFNLKLKAHYARQVERAEKSGAKVLSEDESARLFNRAGNIVWLTSAAYNKYVELKDQPSQDKEKRSWKQLLDGHVGTVIAIDPQGKAHYFAPKAEAERVLKEVHGIKPEGRYDMSNYKASQKKRQDEKKLRQATAAEIVSWILDGDRLKLLDEKPVGTVFADSHFLRLVAKHLIDNGGADAARAIAKRRGIEYDTAHIRGSVIKIADSVDEKDLLGLVVECLIQQELDYWAQWGGDSRDKFPLCDYFGLKPNAVLKEVSAKLKAEAKAKKQPKAKVKAAAGM